MCKYCLPKYRVAKGAIAERIGGRDRPIYIMRFDNPVDGYFYGLVEEEVFYFSNYEYAEHGTELHCIVPLNYCPECGSSLV